MNNASLPTIEELAQGSFRAIANAQELLEDAKLLFQKGSNARAYALALLSYEEMGKSLVIARLIYTDGSDIEGLKAFWQRFHSHKLKLGNSILLLARSLLDESDPDEFRWKWVKKNLSVLRVAYQSAKESGMYVDYKKGRFTLPSEEFMGPTYDTKQQLALCEWTLQVLLTIFRSEEDVLIAFKAARATAKRLGFERIRYNDASTLMRMFTAAMGNDPM